MCSFVEVSEYRYNLLADNTNVNIVDFGTGKNRRSKIKTIVKKASTSSIHGGMLQKLVHTFNLQSALELGTSLGVGTMFLAKASSKMQVTTIEASVELHNFTKEQFNQRNIENVKFINNDIDTVFDTNLLDYKKFDIFYLDGNHTYEATIKYYNYIRKNLCGKKAIIVVDDINWSRAMYKAWKEISKSEQNALRVNLFQVGIVFIGYKMPELEVMAEFVKDNF